MSPKTSSLSSMSNELRGGFTRKGEADATPPVVIPQPAPSPEPPTPIASQADEAAERQSAETATAARQDPVWITQAEAPRPASKPRQPRPVAPAVQAIVTPDILQRPTRAFERTASPAAAIAATKVQLGLRLPPARHEQLRRICFELRIPVQACVEEVLYRWMDAFDQEGQGG